VRLFCQSCGGLVDALQSTGVPDPSGHPLPLALDLCLSCRRRILVYAPVLRSYRREDRRRFELRQQQLRTDPALRRAAGAALSLTR
jgi:hypothetical protein